MFFEGIKSLLHFGILAALLSASLPLQASEPLVGAIRWDAQVGDRYDYGSKENLYLSPESYRDRLPFYAEIRVDGSVSIDGTDPQTMEKEIAFATEGGLDYWAFLTYDDDPDQWGYGLSIQLANYLKSPSRSDINFTVILAGHVIIGDDASKWDRWFKRYVEYLKEPNYQTTLNGRPLVYTFRYAGWEKSEAFLRQFEKACEAAGLLEPYLVDLHWNDTLTDGVDAMSSYANGVYWDDGQLTDILPYRDQIECDLQKWETRKRAGVKQVPIVTLGWDGRPRLELKKDKETHRMYTPIIDTGTPGEIAENVMNAVRFVKANPANCEANAVLLYGWNEFSEGGSLCPFLPEHGGNARLAAIAAAREETVTTSRIHSKKPNILFVLADDLGYEDLACYGNDFHETPHIDRLAAEGIRLTRHYSSAAVCSPTRASILTGNFPARIHVTEVYNWGFKSDPKSPLYCELDDYMDPSWDYLPQSMSALGYATGLFGKWHLEGVTPRQTGFDTVRINYPRVQGEWFDEGAFDNDDWKTDQITKDAIAFMEGSLDRGEPFFAFVSHNLPHVPWGTRSDLLEKYRKKQDAGKDFQGPAYAGMIEQLDESVGAMMAVLEERGVLDNTLVIFTSDNGPVGHAETHLARMKSYPHEGGIRVPFVARWGNEIAAGKTEDHLVVSSDYFKTFYRIGGGDPKKLDTDSTVKDSEDFLPILRGGKAGERPPIIFHFPLGRSFIGGWSAILNGSMKYIHHWETELVPEVARPSEKTHKLFDLKRDEQEKRNLIDEKPGVARKLRETLLDWLEANDCQIPEKRKPSLSGKQHQAVIGVEQKAEYAKDWWMPRHLEILEQNRSRNPDVVFLGDSITNSWENMGKKVWQKYFGDRNAVNFGFGGDKTQHLIWRIDNGQLKGLDPRLAVLMIGTNNAWDGNPQETFEGVEEVCLKIRHELPNTKILLLGILPRGEAGDEKRAVNEDANALISGLADGEKIFFLDLNEHFLGAGDGLKKGLFREDGVHLSKAGYQTWAEEMEPTFSRLLETSVAGR